jgi:hypothetical protein
MNLTAVNKINFKYMYNKSFFVILFETIKNYALIIFFIIDMS